MSCVRDYDCYQVTLKVKLSEKYGCIYRKYGNLECFNVRQVAPGKVAGCDYSSVDQSAEAAVIPNDGVIFAVELDRCDCTVAYFSIYVKLPCKLQCIGAPQTTPAVPPPVQNIALTGNYESTKFSLSFVECGHATEIVTFLVNPLPYNVVSSGLLNDCVSYEITRVPCRFSTTPQCVVPTTSTTSTTANPLGDCCCANVPPFFGGDVLQISFPLSEASKCILMDFGLSGTLLNIALSNIIKIKVRIVSNCPVKFSFPALLTFDREKCKACLEVRPLFAIPQEGMPGGALNPHYLIAGYEYMYGTLGCLLSGAPVNFAELVCNDDYQASQYIFANISEPLDNDGDSINPDKPFLERANALYRLFASSTKLDVMGVDKCVEKVLFSFQLCTTQFNDLSDAGFTTEPEDYGCLPTVNLKNGFRVQSESNNYQYEISVSDAALTQGASECTTNPPP
jgi:hypothetical protein